MTSFDVFADDPTPTTGGPYEHDLPPGCRCYYREDIDWGDVRTAAPGGCRIHSCTCLAAALGGLHTAACVHTALTQPNAMINDAGPVTPE